MDQTHTFQIIFYLIYIQYITCTLHIIIYDIFRAEIHANIDAALVLVMYIKQAMILCLLLDAEGINKIEFF